jgi:DNA adenine methylase
MTTIKAPFPYWGGKRKAAAAIWDRFGNVPNYVEPFCGSCAVLLSRPHDAQTETVNDADGLLSNFWRAVKADPDAVAYHADWPVNENDLHARHSWLVGQKDSLQSRLEGDPDYFDTKIAGWWVWGCACWIGSGWCSGEGPWQVQEVDGMRKLVHVGDQGRGVNRKRVTIAGPAGGCAPLPENEDLCAYFRQLCDRLRRVRVCCGDWTRVMGESVTIKHGMTGILLDPPYADTANRDNRLYRVDSETVAHAVREWAIENGDNPLMRIALCGYEGEHIMPESWECFAWNAGQGFGGQAKERTENGKRERIWFSPACIRWVKHEERNLL